MTTAIEQLIRELKEKELNLSRGVLKEYFEPKDYMLSDIITRLQQIVDQEKEKV